MWARVMWATLGEHHIDVEIARHRVVQVERTVIERHALWREIVRPDNGRIATGGAATEVGLIDDGDVGHSVVLREVVRRREAVHTTADDHRVVGRLQVKLTPDARPSLVCQPPLD